MVSDMLGYLKMGWSKIGLINKVVRLSGWSHSKVPLPGVPLYIV